jgi:hypothetical protein
MAMQAFSRGIVGFMEKKHSSPKLNFLENQGKPFQRLNQ